MKTTDKLAPGWQISPYDVLNGMFAATTDTLPAGTFVTIASAVGNHAVTGSGATPFVTVDRKVSSAPSYAYSPYWGVKDTVRAALSGEPVLGVTMYDVAETNAFGESYRRLPDYARQEQQVVLSGEAVPIAKRGLIRTNNIFGTAPSAGTGAYVSSGQLRVGNYFTLKASGQCVGKFLSAVDNQGYAMFQVECG